MNIFKYSLICLSIVSLGFGQAVSKPKLTINPKVRIKDVVKIKGQTSHVMIGYGLVVGLAGTGDSDEELTQKTIANLLQNFNMKIDDGSIKALNVAAVMITAEVKGSAHKDQLIQCTVSTLGDARSLQGGQLLPTPLKSMDGKLAAMAQGAVVTGGFQFGNNIPGGNQVQRNHVNTGVVTNGVRLFKDIGLGLKNQDMMTLILPQPDFTTAANIVDAINEKFIGSASAPDASTVRVRIPKKYRDLQKVTSFVRDVEQIQFTKDNMAKIVFNERTGTIIIGGDVKISSVAISHGNLTISIKNLTKISQPLPDSNGETVVANEQETEAVEDNVKLIPIPATTTVNELVNVLNNLRVSPRDMMIIFHALRESGALHASLESM